MRTLTLADYRDSPVRVDRRLVGAKEAIFDGKVVWVSPAIASLYDDRSNADSWMFAMLHVEIVRAPTVAQYLKALRGRDD